MSEVEDRLFGLMEVADRQQAMVQVAIEGLQAERALLQGEREAQTREMAAMAERQQAAAALVLEQLTREQVLLQRERDALARGVTAMERSVAAAADRAVRASLADAGATAAAAVKESTKPLLERLGGVVEGAVQAEAALRRVVLWASWRLLGWVAGVAVVLMLVGWEAGSAVVWWDARTIATTRLERAQLQTEVANLKANRDSWINAGMLERLQHCGPERRLCVRVDEGAGRFMDEDFRVIKGY